MELNRVQQSRTHLALLHALGLTSETPETAEGRSKAEFAFAASHSPEMLSEAILLATALKEHAGHGDFSFVMKDLAVACDNLELAKSAAKLAGAIHIRRGTWSTAPEQNARRIEIPPTLLREYLEEWACHLPF